MPDQNFRNHARYVPSFHFGLLSIVLAVTVIAIINLISAIKGDTGLLSAVMFILIAIALIISFLKIRSFPIAAQDRAIRAEENLRHFSLTGKLLDKRLTMPQIIALRFASDEEFLILADRAVKENLSNKSIKKAIQNWKADNHRA
jgi:Family of unknown function (DUF6526)